MVATVGAAALCACLLPLALAGAQAAKGEADRARSSWLAFVFEPQRVGRTNDALRERVRCGGGSRGKITRCRSRVTAAPAFKTASLLHLRTQRRL